jgi:hypothetical protein
MPMLSLRVKVLIAIALVSFVAGGCGALVRGFWGVSHDCQEWVNRNGYQLVHNDWWTKSDGCIARTAAGDELSHSEGLDAKATGWAWQFAIFALGCLPAVTIVAVSRRRRRRGPPYDP